MEKHNILLTCSMNQCILTTLGELISKYSDPTNATVSLSDLVKAINQSCQNWTMHGVPNRELFIGRSIWNLCRLQVLKSHFAPSEQEARFAFFKPARREKQIQEQADDIFLHFVCDLNNEGFLEDDDFDGFGDDGYVFAKDNNYAEQVTKAVEEKEFNADNPPHEEQVLEWNGLLDLDHDVGVHLLQLMAAAKSDHSINSVNENMEHNPGPQNPNVNNHNNLNVIINDNNANAAMNDNVINDNDINNNNVNVANNDVINDNVDIDDNEFIEFHGDGPWNIPVDDLDEFFQVF